MKKLKNDYDTYFDFDDEQRVLVQKLLIAEYLNQYPINTVIEAMYEDMLLYEEAEKFETCQLFKDALNIIDEP